MQLAKLIGEAQYQAWFGEAEFLDGEPFKIIMPTLMKRNWVEDRFSTSMRKVFEESAIIEVRASPGYEPQSQACGPSKRDWGGG
ncbi:MAG: DnaA N-terminal domain-containing protein [Nitrosospira sp.]